MARVQWNSGMKRLSDHHLQDLSEIGFSPVALTEEVVTKPPSSFTPPIDDLSGVTGVDSSEPISAPEPELSSDV
eukprot:929989-Amphidinium_carterae.2